MAICEQGYLCEVCGLDVADLVESDLYLRYVLGEVDPGDPAPEPRASPALQPRALAQFIVADDFAPVEVAGFFDKSTLDPEYVAEEEERVTRAYRRLQELMTLELPIVEYPPPEVRARWLRDDRATTRAR